MNEFTPPRTSSKDITLKASKIVLSAVSGPVAELFSKIIIPPIERRREEWMETVAASLSILEERQKGLIERLGNDEYFFDVLMHATQIALRNHQKEKKEALRNAILNSALNKSPDISIQQVFLNYIDTFTIWHIKLLNFFDDPIKTISDLGCPDLPKSSYWSYEKTFMLVFPELKEKGTFYLLVWKQLLEANFISLQKIDMQVTSKATLEKRITGFGKMFLNYIHLDLDE